MGCVWGALRRSGAGGMAGGRTPPGLRERVDLEFLWWIFRYNDTRRAAVLHRLASVPPTTRVISLRSRRAAREFLAGLDQSMTSAWSS